VHVNVSQSRELQHRRYILVLRDFRPILAAQRRSLETRRLAAIGETMTALAHESRNALQRMQSCLSLIRVRGSADVQELVDDMQDAQDQLQRLYEEIRSFASPTQLQLQSADVGRLLDKTWRQLKVLSTERSLSWSRSQAADVDPVVKADSRRLGQVFRNVLENAIEASPACGRILVSVCDSDQGGEPGVRIAVDDEGPGVPPDTAERVFDLLYTTKPDGTGMGLAIAARIVREHGGEICVGRSDQGGARVEITLPRDPET
jgi:two-component system sensor kinase FixL